MIIFVVGMPLAGKSTLTRRLAYDFHLPYVSTGEIARSLSMQTENSIKTLDLSLKFNDQINQIVLNTCYRDCIIDGYPRSVEQFNLIKNLNYKILFITANPVTIYERLENRKITEHRQEDLFDVVIGRIERSLVWCKELRKLAGDRFIEFNENRGYKEFKVCAS